MYYHYLIQGNSKSALSHLPNESIHVCVTSPPYYNARDYAQWETLEAYMGDMEQIFLEVWRVLQNHRACIINVADIIGMVKKQTYSTTKIPLTSLFTQMMIKIGFEYVDMIIWDKGESESKRSVIGVVNPTPMYFYPANCYETILILHPPTYLLSDLSNGNKHKKE